MKFEDKFKPGDVICSDSFYNGKCMVVEDAVTTMLPQKRIISGGDGFRYRCADLILPNQTWLVPKDHSLYHKTYNWRIATDDDIIKYLDRFVTIDLGNVGSYNVTLTDTGISLDDGYGGEYGCTHLEAEDLVELRKIINKYVVTEAEIAKDNYYKNHKAWEWGL